MPAIMAPYMGFRLAELSQMADRTESYGALACPCHKRRAGDGWLFSMPASQDIKYVGDGLTIFVSSAKGMRDAAAASAAAAALAQGPTDAQVRDGINRANIAGQVAEAVSMAPDVVAAAAAAVTNALVQENLSITLVERPSPTVPQTVTRTALRGTPTFAAGKFGNAASGPAAIQHSGLPDINGDYTVKFSLKHVGAPGGSKVIVALPGIYIGLHTTGQIFLNDPSAVAGPSVVDGNWHHVALVYRRVAATSKRTMGLWVDGARIVAAGASSGQTAWDGNLVFGGFASSGTLNVAAVDAARISHGVAGRYSTDTFAVPTAAPVLDSSSLLVAQFESFSATKAGIEGALGYDTRPANGPPTK
ncbi:hypothetical protein QE394_002883 [Arthrobacter sp. SORGH_AS 212]|nr:hypothetical protein [Arthrobacter sp. SORGH_AS_0212]